ncbi:MAG: hypothetical protein BAA01_04530 [Bacillus thermozeamaize]|jgi:acyl-CoA thioester hydrolase|uniref:Thioesterase domain-containing protein n=1 Tax=Bacillus thermozeamaize TaxID=230954 RepID=A0A1Y3PAE3_9BACI|nr:MAG: hypothetical protein BAA01_04530 [Bacillus thermozeamaize]
MEGYKFSHTLRVRYSEIDGQKIVFNAHYMTYMDVAITEYFREVVRPLPEGEEFDFVLVKTTIEFKGSAYLDDILRIFCRTTRLGNTSFTVQFAIQREETKEVIVLAEIVYVSYDLTTRQAVPIPKVVRERIKAYEGIED